MRLAGVVLLVALLMIAVVLVLRHRKKVLLSEIPSSHATTLFHSSHRRRLVPLRQRPTTMVPVEIAGPLKGRGFVRRVLPAYPEWAEEQGATGTVRVRIWAKPDGKVSSIMEMERMSTDLRFDELTLDALKEWEFVPVADTEGTQWGTITFHFILKNAA